MRKKCKKCDKPATQGRFDGFFCDEHAKERDAKFAAFVEEVRKVGEAEARKEEERRAGANIHRLGYHDTLKAEHTQGKITVSGHASYYGAYCIDQVYSGTSDGSMDAFELDEANAARLELCWNSHDELVAMLRDCVDILSTHPDSY